MVIIEDRDADIYDVFVGAQTAPTTTCSRPPSGKPGGLSLRTRLSSPDGLAIIGCTSHDKLPEGYPKKDQVLANHLANSRKRSGPVVPDD